MTPPPNPCHIDPLSLCGCSTAQPLGPFGSINHIFRRERVFAAPIRWCTVDRAARATSNTQSVMRDCGAAGQKSVPALPTANRPMPRSCLIVHPTLRQRLNTAANAKTAGICAPIAVFTAASAAPYPVAARPVRRATTAQPAISIPATATVAWAHAHATSIRAANAAPYANRPYVHVKNATSCRQHPLALRALNCQTSVQRAVARSVTSRAPHPWRAAR